jgi:hypothetical protein
MFSKIELDRLRQWFNALHAANPKLLKSPDSDLMRKIEALMKQRDSQSPDNPSAD